ncbi:MAG TPA: SusC/RagA family TonB-linked outer membrane protein [Chitinophaga sp.]|uniref:SusC/RagA family TonB-linked outer membrane protein n=1 Tax=Chitinophaga sp. TaxID=1869181 RepID=UPI002B9EFAB7|nr:SusC/RagA family TonB-linked outer membrane protein [Chitinophaga sp.]HVI44027.1 SusC/RagA family TonB-linked outer membrane protein [Chitinophaga sp.]
MKKNLWEFTRQLMRVSTIFLGIMVLSAGLLQAHTGNAQRVKGIRLSISFNHQSLAAAISALEKNTRLSFAYDKKKLEQLKAPDTAFSNAPLDRILNRLLAGTVYSYDVINDNITIGRDFSKVMERAKPGLLTGRIIDAANGEELPGASIRLKESGKGIVADASGNYRLEGIVPGRYTLIASSVGYEPYSNTINVEEGAELTLNIQMKVKNNLTEVVVTALGLKKEQTTLAYSVATVKGEDFTKAREPNVAFSLEGKVAGVNVVKPVSGAMGSSRVVIRGNGSISGNNQPLYVVDGVPLVNNTYGQSSVYYGGSDGGDGISSINPDDIETMSVLKGGPAAALYGARAANGVILITTKSGKSRKGLGVEYNGSYTLDKPLFYNKKDFQYEYGQGTGGIAPKDAATARAVGPYSWGARLDGSPVMQFDGVARPYSAVKDNVKNFYNNANTFTNNVSIYGGNEKVNARFSVADLNNHDLMPNSSLRRQNYTLHANAVLADKLTMQVNAMFVHEKVRNRPYSGDFSWNPHMAVQLLPTNLDVRTQNRRVDDKGKEYLFSDNIYFANPYFMAYNRLSSDIKNRLIASADLKYNITNALYARLLTGTDMAYRYSEGINPEGGAIARPSIGVSQRFDNEFNAQLQVGYDKEFGKDISLSAFVGGNIMKNVNSTTSAGGSEFIVPGFYAVNNTKTLSRGYSRYEKEFNSLFGSAEIGFRKYLYLTVTGRNDWFSTLNPKTNSIFYPSVGMSYVLSQSVKLPSWVTYAKLRAAWAKTGNDADISPYSQALSYGFGNTYLGQPTAYVSSSAIPNTRLQPSVSRLVEGGFDARFLQDRLGLQFTWYNRYTTNDILTSQISITSGFNSVRLNAGEMRNTGVEIMLTGTPVRHGKLSWDMSLNLGYNKNKILALVDGQSSMVLQQSRPGLYSDGGVPAYIAAKVGEPFGIITGTTYKRDANGNIVFNAQGYPVKGDIVTLGNSVPPLTMGLNNDFRYGRFFASVLIDAKFGAKISSGTNNLAYEKGLLKSTLEGRETGITGKGVTETGDVNKVTVSAESYYKWVANSIAEEFVYDASFVKLRQLVIGVNLPHSWLSRLKINDASLSVVGRNLWTIYSKVPLVDPESTFLNGNIQGLEMLSLPATRSFGVNLNVKF